MPGVPARFVALTLGVTLAAAIPSTALIIPAGEDHWATPGDGKTTFTFPIGDVEALCGAEVDFAWDRKVILVGAPEPGEDWDTVVARLEDANVAIGSASVPIQVKHLDLQSLKSQETPCGTIHWYVTALRHQPVTKMRIHYFNNHSGQFDAITSARVAFEAFDTDGVALGLLYYSLELHGAARGNWSFDTYGNFRVGFGPVDE